MIENMRASAYWLAFIAQTLAVSVEVVLRTRMGSRAIALRGLAAFFLIPLWMVFFPGQEAGPLMWFWCLYVWGCVRQRVGSAQGDLGHSRYSGESVLRRIFPRCSELKVKGKIEPVFVVVIGLFLLPLNQPLGSFLIAAGIGLGASVGLGESVERAKVRELNDARIDQQDVIDRFRQEHDQ